MRVISCFDWYCSFTQVIYIVKQSWNTFFHTFLTRIFNLICSILEINLLQTRCCYIGRHKQNPVDPRGQIGNERRDERERERELFVILSCVQILRFFKFCIIKCFEHKLIQYGVRIFFMNSEYIKYFPGARSSCAYANCSWCPKWK